MDSINENEEYSFLRISEEHYNFLCEISLSAFGFSPGKDYYIKKNRQVDDLPRHLGFIAFTREGEPAAFYGVYAYPATLNGFRFIAAQSGDTMTHKSHVGKGLFTKLARLTYDLAKSEGVDFIFGFPNSNSFPGFAKKLNWTFRSNLKEYRDKVLTIPIAKIAKRFRMFNPIYSSYLNIIIKTYSKGLFFKNSVLRSDVGGIEHSKEFTDYKCLFGSRFIKIGGVNIWFKVDGYLLIGDIQNKEDINYRVLWNKIKRFSTIIGADAIIFQSSENSTIANKLSEFLGERDSLPDGFLNLSMKTDPSLFLYVLGDVDTF